MTDLRITFGHLDDELKANATQQQNQLTSLETALIDINEVRSCLVFGS